MSAESPKPFPIIVHVANIFDAMDHDVGRIAENDVRSIGPVSAVVDTTASLLLLPRSIIEQLGLKDAGAVGHLGIESAPVRIFHSVRLTISGRICTMDVGEICDDQRIIVGRIPLTALGFEVGLNGSVLVDDEWDLLFEADVKAGRLDALGEEALSDFRKGLCRPI